MTIQFSPTHELSVTAADGKTYAYVNTAASGAAPVFEIREAGVTTAVAAGSKEEKAAVQALADGFKVFSETPGHSTEAIEMFGQVAGFARTKNPAAMTQIGEAITNAGQIKAILAQTTPITAANRATIEDCLVKDPNAVNLLTGAEHAVLADETKLGVKFIEIQKTVSRINGVHTDIKALVDAKNITQESVENLIRKHGAEIFDRVEPAAKAALNAGPRVVVSGTAAAPVDYAAAITKVKAEITAAKGQAGPLLDRIAASTRTIESSRMGFGLGATKTALDADIKAFNELVNKNPKIQHHLYELIDNHADKAVLEKVSGLKSSLSSISTAAAASPLAKGTESTAKKGAGFFKEQFTVTEGFKAKELEKAAGNVEKIAKIGKMELGAVRWGKVGAVGAGVAAVTGLVYAAMGNNTGPGPNARGVQQRDQRDMELAGAGAGR